MLLLLTPSAGSGFDFSNSNYNYDNTNTNVSSHLCKEFCSVNLADSAKNQDQERSIGKK
jgi:hypothetical protein